MIERRGMRCPYVIVFDAQCHFCNASVDFIIKGDPKGLFCFAPMDSSMGQSLVLEQGLGGLDSDTIVLIKQDKAYLRAEAVYEILKDLESFWSFLGIFRSLGTSCNDSLYRYIAKNRHRIFSKRSCQTPSEKVRSRFLTDTV